MIKPYNSIRNLLPPHEDFKCMAEWLLNEHSAVEVVARLLDVIDCIECFNGWPSTRNEIQELMQVEEKVKRPIKDLISRHADSIEDYGEGLMQYGFTQFGLDNFINDLHRHFEELKP